MKTNYSKTCMLPQDLIPLLRTRGLSIPDEQRAISYLTTIGYFRLSAYLHPLLKEPKTDHHYKDGATFEMALQMYRFDRKLRLLLFNEIEKIEVAIRSAIINRASHDLNDIFWITDAIHFHNPNVFEKTFKLIQSEIHKSTAEFILHFRNKYSNPYPPAWMIAEIITLGIMCVTYGNLKSRNIQKKIATCFGLSVPVFSSWIMILSNLRNLCGHHVRIWNRENPVVPVELKSPAFPWINTTTIDPRRIYFRICIIKYLLFTVSPHNSFAQKLKSLVAEYPTVDICAMGFPTNWQDAPLWQ